ncbi:MAG: selenocysteine-specific translation elongation factor [Anaerolineales bacterium]
MHVICTAGHVDHGKSTLVEALTGTHPDRLKEEREREMTIDLGFAWLTLPNGEPVGIVDVPGHRDFIENMLAGVGGVDAALLVIAADEGVMPQTQEHLAILDLLQVPAGVVALTKADLVEEEEWLQLVAEEVSEALQGTTLEDAPIVPVAAIGSRRGVSDVLTALADCLGAQPQKPDFGQPRLPVDRVFTISGFGTVVTGTLAGGSLRVGDEVTLYPEGRSARIRGLQTHKTKLETAQPGSRVAVNLSGVDKADVERGAVVARPNTLSPTRRIDVHFRHLGEAHGTRPLKHNAEVKFFVGAAEVMARARVLGQRALPPGEEGWLQLELSAPVAVGRGDRFILRRPSPPATIGGGVVVDPYPRRRHRLKDPAVIARLETLARGTPGEMLLQAIDTQGPGVLSAAVARAGLDEAAAKSALDELRMAGTLLALDSSAPLHPASPTLVTSIAGWNQFVGRVEELLAVYHAAQPLRTGMPREELKSRLGFDARVFNALLAKAHADGVLVTSKAAVRLPGHVVKFSSGQQRRVDALLDTFARKPYNTPSRKDAIAAVGDDVLAALLEQEQLVAEVLFSGETYAEMAARIRAALEGGRSLTVAQVRDMFGTSRKYALAMMEHLDAEGVTIRRGDERVLRG